MLILVGTKLDEKTKIVVSLDQANKWAETHNMGYYEVSSKEQINVTRLFENCIRESFTKFRKENVKKNVTEFKVQNRKSKNKGCFEKFFSWIGF